MRDLNWIIESNGPEPRRRPPTENETMVADREARARIGYCAEILRESMTLHPVEMRDLAAQIYLALTKVRG